MAKERRGRPRKIGMGYVVIDKDGNLGVAVDHRILGSRSEYRVIPVNSRIQRYGPATWRNTESIEPEGRRSQTGSVKVYRANQALDEELGGRGCKCQCCVHYAMPLKDFSTQTGKLRKVVDVES